MHRPIWLKSRQKISSAMLMTIHIDRMKQHAYHGVLPQERVVGADFYVSVAAQVEVLPSAWQEDCLDGTADYSLIVAVVKREMAVASHLLEHAAARIASGILRACPSVKEVIVHLEKENPPLGVLCEGLGVKIKQTR